MKKLKKVLSLVLVLAMVFSFATTAFAAGTTYDDDDQIQYTEAVQVMTDMGIINGKGDNLFAPTDQFLRSEAAKIITYMKLGPKVAETLKGKDGLYTDVAADEWFAPYVAYATAQKIIAGNGDGTFEPEADLTREAWLKILLCGILGVDAEKEGLVNNNAWEVNALTLAIDKKIITTEEAVLPFNRDVAVLYAWNAMTKTSYGADKFELTKKTGTEIGDTRDDYRRPYTKWTFNCGKEETVIPATPVKVYENETVKVDAIKKELPKDATLAIVEDGNNTTKTEIGGRGTVVELYDAGNKYIAVVINTFAATVETVTKAEGETKASVTLSDNTVIETDDYAKGDVVLYTKANDKIQSHEKATVVEGKVTAVAANYVRINGEIKYLAAKPVTGYALPTAIAGKDDAAKNYYFDTYGNLVYEAAIPGTVEPPKGPDGVFYVIKTAYAEGKGGKDIWDNDVVISEPIAQAMVVNLSTGEVEIVDRTLTKDGKVDGVESITDAFVEYTKAEDNTYKFDTANQKTVSTTKDKVGTGVKDKYITDATEITVVTTSTNEKGETTYAVTTATGLPTFTASKAAGMLIDANDDGDVEALYLVVAATDPKPVETESLAVYLGKGELDANGRVYKFAQNGKTVEYYGEEGAVTVNEDTVVDLKLKDGKVASATETTLTKVTPRTVVSVNSTYVRTNVGVNYFAEEYEIVDATDDYKAASLTKGDTFDLYHSDGELVFAVITAHAE